jgi:hypothetical protein
VTKPSGPNPAHRMWTPTLMAKNSMNIPNDIAALHGQRFLFASETKEGGKAGGNTHQRFHWG